MLEGTDPGGGIRVLVSQNLRAEGFLAAFTERTGGVSRGVYAELNLGYRYGDDVASVQENRRRICEALGIAGFACPELVHGTRAVRVGPRRAGAGFDRPDGLIQGADALVVTARRRPVVVMAADCLMVALAHARSGTLAVVHAGWRGLAAGILSRSLGLFDRAPEVLAAVGPTVGPDHYEVGPEVLSAFAASSGRGAVAERRGGRWHLDLPGTAERILRDHGVRRIEHARACTHCEADRFYSYPREGRSGWQGLVAQRP